VIAVTSARQTITNAHAGYAPIPEQVCAGRPLFQIASSRLCFDADGIHDAEPTAVRRMKNRGGCGFRRDDGRM